MQGVILFADDMIHERVQKQDGSSEGTNENCLFNSLNKDYPVIGVNTRELLKKSIESIGTFSALILDWQFNDDEEDALFSAEDETIKFLERPSSKEDATLTFLKENDFHSLIYILSEKDVQLEHGDFLRGKFGERIQFKQKTDLNNTEEAKKQIILDIENWKTKNQKLLVPLFWSQSINKSLQKIFSKLYSIDPNWITELYITSQKDRPNPEIEVVNLFQNVLCETIIQDKILLSKIKEVAEKGDQLSNPEDYAKLIRILYYGQVNIDDPIMTGDIFKLGEDKYAIIITPECDIRHTISKPVENSFEVLLFSKDDFKKTPFKLKAKIKANPIITKAETFKTCKFSKAEKIEVSAELNKQITEAEHSLQIEAFTQTNPRIHILPCFEFKKDDFSGIALIDFRFGLSLVKAELIISKVKNDRVCKLNSPYIQELRQRYLSYKGRVGVSGYSETLRKWLVAQN
jgi:hypothetical protein